MIKTILERVSVEMSAREYDYQNNANVLTSICLIAAYHQFESVVKLLEAEEKLEEGEEE